jgi:hypothetical protein
MRSYNDSTILGRNILNVTLPPRHTYPLVSSGFKFWFKATSPGVEGDARICFPGNYKIVKKSGRLKIENN